MPLTQKQIRERHRAKQWVKEKEAAYSLQRYAEVKCDPERYSRRLKQARESSILRKWRGEATAAGLKFVGESRSKMCAVFISALLEMKRESRERKIEWRHLYEKNPKCLARRSAWRKTENGRRSIALRARRIRLKNPSHRIAGNLRKRIVEAIRGRACKSGRLADLIGTTIGQFMRHLELQWTEGMTWDNYGNGDGKWNCDHKQPCASFDLTDPDQQKLCFHYTNCQPMWYRDNCIKSNRLPDGTLARVNRRLTDHTVNDNVTELCQKLLISR